MSDKDNEQFNFSERLGLFVLVQASSLSALTVSGLLLYVAYRSFKRWRIRRQVCNRETTAGLKVLNQIAVKGDAIQPFDASDSSLFVNLMVSDLIQAIGGLLNFQWVVDGTLTEGSLCTTQGVLKQVGDVGVALSAFGIAVQTFSVLALRWYMPRLVARILIATIWLFIFLAVTVAELTHHKEYYGNTGFWCWINAQYRPERIALEYLWMWLAALLMLILYGILALVMRGIIHLRNDEDGIQEDEDGNMVGGISVVIDREEKGQSKAVANLMLFYPAVYIICITPAATVRWLAFSGHNVPPAATISGSLIFLLSGFFNGVLYRYTRPELVIGPKDDILARVPRDNIDKSQSDSISSSSIRYSRSTGMGYLTEVADIDMSPSSHRDFATNALPSIETPSTMQPDDHRSLSRERRSRPRSSRRRSHLRSMPSISTVLTSDTNATSSPSSSV